MALEAGTSLGHYEVLSSLGAGGMGEVYRAKDTKLGREVAIKLLLEDVSTDPERMARFEREARVLASLNHTSIATLFGFEKHEDTSFLVMEVVEGETLADRIRRGAIPEDEALPLFLQIAEGLEAAHEKGVIHRDLKPANIKVTDDGQVKILDFGLAKAMSGESEPSNEAPLSMSPTLTLAATQRGEILGTAAYMSPEQAQGEPVDKRTDIWAFGVCLFEALTGRQVFEGDKASMMLASVLKDEPDFNLLPEATPPSVRRVLERCLVKSAKDRLRDIGDVRLELREIQERLEERLRTGEVELSEVVSKAAPAWRLLVVGVVLGLGAALGAWMVLPSKAGSAASETGVVRFGLPAPEGHVFFRGLAVSPDGSKVAMTLRTPGGRSEIWVRSLDTLEMQRLPGTEGSTRFPFWSADGNEVGFLTEYELRAADLIGSPPRTLASGLNQGHDTRGGAWGADGTIVYAPTYIGGLMRVPATGGKPELATVLDPTTGNGTHRFPSFLPDGRHFTFYAATGSGAEPGEIRLGELGSTVSRRLTASNSAAVFTPPNHLLFTRGDALVAQKIDLDTLETVGKSCAARYRITRRPLRLRTTLSFNLQRGHARLSGRRRVLDANGMGGSRGQPVG